MAMTRSNFSPLLLEGLREVFFLHLKEKDMVYPRIFDVRTSKKYSEQDYGVGALDMLSAKTEGEPLDYDDYILGATKTFTHTAYAKGLRFTRELLDDELYGVMKDRTKALARSARYRIEYDHAAIFNNASSSSYAGADSLALISASHTRADGGTVLSNSASGAALSQSALETAFTAFREQKDDRGLLIAITPKTLLIPPELEFDAMEILNSTGKAYTADNEINALKGRLNIVVWDFLTGSDDWFILADKSDGAPISYKRVAPEFDHDGDFDTKDQKVSVYTRYSCGHSDWRWCYGSAD